MEGLSRDYGLVGGAGHSGWIVGRCLVDGDFVWRGLIIAIRAAPGGKDHGKQSEIGGEMSFTEIAIFVTLWITVDVGFLVGRLDALEKRIGMLDKNLGNNLDRNTEALRGEIRELGKELNGGEVRRWAIFPLHFLAKCPRL